MPILRVLNTTYGSDIFGTLEATEREIPNDFSPRNQRKDSSSIRYFPDTP